ncbi:MAG: hypothetical protein ACI9HX_000529, partial [Pseudoalteromonas tetraodonis]
MITARLIERILNVACLLAAVTLAGCGGSDNATLESN